MIKIKCLGASHEVGRSGFEVNYNNTNLLLDYGLKINNDTVDYPQKPESIIKHVLLSHAHLDHCGMIPWLFQKYRPHVYLTAPTLDIAQILWEDTLKIARLEKNPLPFSKENILDAVHNCQIINYKQKIQIDKDISFEMFDAGHIIGSALTKIDFDKKSLLYTGDYKLESSSLHQGADLDIDSPNYMLIESTYGDRDHKNREQVEKEFIDNIKLALEEGSTIIIPAFAVGRSQEIIEILDKYKITDVPIFLDGMGQKVSKTYLRYPGFINESYRLKTALENVYFVTNQQERKKATQKQSIIVTTAGMLEGGPVLQYIERKLGDKRTKVYLTGFQMPGTNGHNLLHNKQLIIDDKLVNVPFEVKHFDFSAHIGKLDLMRSISQLNPEKVICVHGDDKVVDTFARDIEKQLGIKAIAPKLGDTVKLD